ncbi:hypothetical protein DXG03_002544 [Asterophora parasitica]|uniref:CCHC-type domain-containing protein n=1 Tax=Asterophora parasitica TaxID=117018 RepID=A0A9P7K682_9AGAR|nr:hypothetical protein DXG03_002544 [Asterophora parasitica]
MQRLEQAINTFAGRIQRLEGGTGGAPPNHQVPAGQTPQNYSPRAPADNCNFCGGTSHFMSGCPEVDRYIQEGRIHRNFDHKIVLPSGAFVPRNYKGIWFKDRIDAWHCRNPNNITTGWLSTNANPQAGMMLEAYQLDCPAPQPGTLNVDGRISILERKLLNLRRHREAFDGVEIQTKLVKRTYVPDVPRRDPLPHMPAAPIPSASSAMSPADTPPTTAAPPTFDKGKERAVTPLANSRVVSEPPAAPQPSQSSSSRPSPQPVAQPAPVPQPAPTLAHVPPVHPYSNIPNNRYIPPSTRNLAATDRRPDPAYRTEAPITNSVKSTKLFDHCLGSMLTVSVGELCSVAPGIRGKLQEAVTPKRVVVTALGSIAEVDDEVCTAHIEELDALPMADDIHSNSTPPLGTLITTDLVDSYYQNLRPGASPECVVMAKESHSLRSILMCVDAREQVECIVDSGCQIIAMSEEVCHDLHIRYNPTIILNMQSANGSIDPSLGLARNVPCMIGDITLYLQIHVIWNPAYNILLGRPFDILTCSSVKTNSADETIITITNPNTRIVTVIASFARGQHWHQSKPPVETEIQNFRILSRK